jgi:hypothetical protein
MRDNNCSIQFDSFGFSVEDPSMRHIILCCNSSDDLYTISPTLPSTAPSRSLTVSTTLWHYNLGHTILCKAFLKQATKRLGQLPASVIHGWIASLATALVNV